MHDRVFLGSSSADVTYWMASLTTAATEYARGIAVAPSGNVYVVGYIDNGFGVTSFLTKMDPNGSVVWQKYLYDSVGFADVSGYSVGVDSSENVYMTGWANTSPQGLTVQKFNSSGSIVWQKMLSTTSGGGTHKITVSSDGTSYISSTFYISGTNTDILVIKLDANGGVLWQRRLGGTGLDYGYGVDVDTSGNVYSSGIGTVSGTDIVVSKWNSTGTIQWQRRLYSTGSDAGYACCVDTSGNVFVAGYTGSTGANDIYIAKWNTSGTLQWQRRLSTTSSDVAYGIDVDSDGNVYVLGQSSGTATGDILLAKYNTSGVIQWQRRIDVGGTNDAGYEIKVDSSNNLHICGTSTSSANGINIFVAKLPPSGALTGTYTLGDISVTYAASSLTAAAGVLTGATTTLTVTTPTIVPTNPALAIDNSTFTTAVTTL